MKKIENAVEFNKFGEFVFNEAGMSLVADEALLESVAGGFLDIRCQTVNECKPTLQAQSDN
ncbi:hypothetical protein [Chromobacterium alticapitis]|uniref:Uncharacterized protein n=1 Tax=Chromobacterium alticapitis TaxID=2073169 RepID=A0A2S5DJ63_9NEIS|nr:hypothetical protein [Chromobacterium alticapitis]POZ63077.1 hypothetical protein C2I19_04520 [Chromobacterium alticapitis]